MISICRPRRKRGKLARPRLRNSLAASVRVHELTQILVGDVRRAYRARNRFCVWGVNAPLTTCWYALADPPPANIDYNFLAVLSGEGQIMFRWQTWLAEFLPLPNLPCVFFFAFSRNFHVWDEETISRSFAISSMFADNRVRKLLYSRLFIWKWISWN